MALAKSYDDVSRASCVSNCLKLLTILTNPSVHLECGKAAFGPCATESYSSTFVTVNAPRMSPAEKPVA